MFGAAIFPQLLLALRRRPLSSQGLSRFEAGPAIGPFGTKEAPAIIESVYNERLVGCTGGEGGAISHSRAGRKQVPKIVPKILALKQAPEPEGELASGPPPKPKPGRQRVPTLAWNI